MLEKTFQPAAIEPRIADKWTKAEAFKTGRSAGGGKNAPYAIVIPPPNVTGSLHMGHALNNTLQDILVRFERMRGRDVLWQPGTDHAGIATQMVVERELAADKQPSRRELGREEFLRRVWAWKEESGGTITNQLKRLGASCDWSRERFTMGKDGAPDDPMVKAVIKAFVDLYNATDPVTGKRLELIYKDKRLVNWDPKFQTAISDLEVVQIEKRGTFSWVSGDPEKPFDADALAKVLAKDPSGHMYYFRYPLAAKVPGYDKDYIVVATTRPETMLGDTGVAVHPDDERYAALVKAGAKVRLPLVGREIPIVADEYSDPTKGTGAVKITPAHDFNDFEVGRRHPEMGSPINVLDENAKIISNPFTAAGPTIYPVAGHPGLLQSNPDGSSSMGSVEQIPEALRGLDRFDARKKVVADIHALGLLEKIEPTTHTVPHGDRSGVVVEPWLTDQWYVNAAEMAKPAIAAVEDGRTEFVPKNWEKTYFEWMRNIQPWCISRQLWWGHQIPAWYGPDGTFFVASSKAEAIKSAAEFYAERQRPFPNGLSGKDYALRLLSGEEDLHQDEDVLDTWFSSALWPFSTMGWPDETTELKTYYPTSVLVTGFDIIFFWVARMMMMGLHFMKEVPFKDVYIHALVRDEKGQKMSKSKGNVMDPLVLIDEFGADALRFTLSAMAAQGRDIKLAKSRVEGYRNFATKLWNASRFAEMNECVREQGFDPKSAKLVVNKWIIGETELATKAVTSALEAYKFNEAANAAYEFVWGQFCDWYLELIKPELMGDDEAAKAETRTVTAWVLDQILKTLHPFMPFITEELWAHMVEHGVARQTLLCTSQWPQLDGLFDQKASDEINWVVDLVSEIRSVRTEMSVPAGAKIPLVLVGASADLKARAERNDDTIKRLARLETIDFVPSAPKGAALIVCGETTAALPLAGVIDMGAEKKRLAKEIEKAQSDLAKMDAKLTNPQFMERAKEEAIEEAKERKSELEAEIKRFTAALKRLGE
ncbi:MAG: valine--tRNA ligase [Hyphomicrobium sp.]|nr:MAG: valine--tRNA ligase [Hyphomicrobium sp.]PPC98522.1 MAG: valine--tRNA ligase [Hyphomicrobium sp.]